jgi:hypothetical protein
MTDPTTVTSDRDPDYSRWQTRQRREARADQTFEVVVERTVITCDGCGETRVVGFYGHREDEVSFGPCSTWGCDAFHRFDLEEPEPCDEPEEVQTDLSAFDGGASA